MRVVGFAWVVLLAVGGLAQSVATADAPCPDGGVAVADTEPWQSWKTEQGYPTNRRLIQPVALSQAHIRIADLLAAAQQQTGVKLSAQESELQDQELTVFARDLPLNALMVQMAQLLGLYWYQRIVDRQIEYVVSYGSSPPGLTAEQEARYWRDVRAARIADYITASSMSDAQLRDLARADPMLGLALQDACGRQAARTLASLSAENRRTLVEAGKVALALSDLPAEYRQMLHEVYAAEARAWEKVGIASEDALADRFRLVYETRDETFTPSGQHSWYRVMYLIHGRMWPGIHVEGCVTPDLFPFQGDGLADPQKPELPLQFEQPFMAVLWGKVEDADQLESFFPSGPDTVNRLALPRLAEIQARRVDSPWKDDPNLSQPTEFDRNKVKRVTDFLAAVADKTGYSVIGTYFASEDREYVHQRDRTPLYELLNIAAWKPKCSWSLAGTVIRWRHDGWYLLEAHRAEKASSPPH